MSRRRNRSRRIDTGGSDAREIPFGFAQGRLSLRLKNGYARDDANVPGSAFPGWCFKLQLLPTIPVTMPGCVVVTIGSDIKF